MGKSESFYSPKTFWKKPEHEIHQELTYSEIDCTIENLWSVLFTTGYLTSRSRTEEGQFYFAIPNKEIRNLFVRQIREWFKDSVKKDPSKLDRFCHAFPVGLLSRKEEWVIRSNAESGIGYSDILAEIFENRTGIVIEVKYAEHGDMEKGCREALE